MDTQRTTLKYTLSYGSHHGQVLDLYLPQDGVNHKTFVLLHGGGWSGGSRTGMNHLIPLLQQAFPAYAIANADYRLASADSPAFPKQVQDIEKIIQYLTECEYGLSGEFAIIGVSAGGHLGLLYSYAHDGAGRVKAVCSIAGPADFTDPYYAAHPYYHYASQFLLGGAARNPGAVTGISPARFVNRQSPPTLLFYGGKDPLVPPSQARRLKEKLDNAGVANKYYNYAEGGHSGWNAQIMKRFGEKMVAFMETHF